VTFEAMAQRTVLECSSPWVRPGKIHVSCHGNAAAVQFVFDSLPG
jgi:hypothetical protein